MARGNLIDAMRSFLDDDSNENRDRVNEILVETMPTELFDRVIQLQEFRKAAANTDLQYHGGGTIILPEKMTYQEAIRYFEEKIKEDESNVNISRTYDSFPLDGAHALMLALTDKFGGAAVKTWIRRGDWGEKTEERATFISISVGLNKKQNVPWGSFTLPGIRGTIKTEWENSATRPLFKLTATVRGADKAKMEEVFDLVEKTLKERSIYKGQPIQISFRDPISGKREFFSPKMCPEFMNVGSLDPIFNPPTTAKIDTSLFIPVRHTQRLRDKGMKVRRTILLHGGYGVGKTLTAAQAARICSENGWTFLSVKEGEDLTMAMTLAKQYAPCMVFAEDADSFMSGDRDKVMNLLSTELDGIATKSDEVIVCLTTNNIDDIQQLMIRPGRIDAVIHIDEPTIDTSYQILMRLLGDDQIGTEADFKAALKPMEGQSGAFITEVVKRAQLAAIGRSEQMQITPEDIATAVSLMLDHVELMKPASEPNEERLNLNDLDVVVRKAS